MVSEFNVQKSEVDMKKVSQSVQNEVNKIKQTEGKKKKIDSEKEFFLLSNLLANNRFTMNRDEVGYVEGLMIDYQNEKAKEFEQDCVTENTKKEVKEIKKRMGNKKEIDTDEEAQALVTMLRNSRGDLNQADIIYIQNLLIKSGFAHYLQTSSPTQVNVTVVVENPKEVDKTEKLKDTEKNETTPVKDTEPFDKPVKPRRKKGGNVKPTPPKNQEENKEYKISEAARAQGFGIANKIEEELHDNWTNNGIIKKEFAKVNRQNAYSFVGKMIEITDSHTVFGDSRKRVSYKELKYVTANLINQAYDIKLNNTQAYFNLKAEYTAINRQLQKDPDKTPDEFDTNRLNKAIKALYDEMSKVYK